MVALDANHAEIPQPLDHRVRLGPVANDITELPDPVDRAGCVDDRLQGGQVGVDVRNNGETHGWSA